MSDAGAQPNIVSKSLFNALYRMAMKNGDGLNLYFVKSVTIVVLVELGLIVILRGLRNISTFSLLKILLVCTLKPDHSYK